MLQVLQNLQLAIEKTVTAIDTDITGIQKDLGNVAAGANALKGTTSSTLFTFCEC